MHGRVAELLGNDDFRLSAISFRLFRESPKHPGTTERQRFLMSRDGWRSCRHPDSRTEGKAQAWRSHHPLSYHETQTWRVFQQLIVP